MGFSAEWVDSAECSGPSGPYGASCWIWEVTTDKAHDLCYATIGFGASEYGETIDTETTDPVSWNTTTRRIEVEGAAIEVLPYAAVQKLTCRG